MEIRSLLILALTFPSCVFAQISDEEAIRKARVYLARIGTVPVERTPVVSHSPDNDRIIVSFDGFVMVWLYYDGTFRMYSNLRRNVSESGAVHFERDEDAWRAAENLLAKFDTPPGLQRHDLRRESEESPTIYCKFDVKPHGYWSEAGNCARVELQAWDGKILRLSISNGFLYEPPDLRISETDARALASAALGGSPSDYLVTIQYRAGASKDDPTYLREMAASRTQRLFYFVTRQEGEGDVSAQIDTVTGQVVGAGRSLSAGIPPTKGGDAPSIGGRSESAETSPDQQTRMVRDAGSTTYGAWWLVGSTLAVLIAVLLSRRLLRKA